MSKIAISLRSVVKWLNEDSISEIEVLLSTMRKFLEPLGSTLPIPARRRPVVESYIHHERKRREGLVGGQERG